MANFQSFTLLTAGLLITQAAAHGHVQGITTDGVPQSSTQSQNSTYSLAAWSAPSTINSVFVNNYTSPDIVCHVGVVPAQTYATVQAGGSIELEWSAWPRGHLGPVLTYLANCNGECTTVNKSTLLFNKIDEAGLIQGGSSPIWAVNELIANNYAWNLSIPANIAPGNYVLRHEIIALHDANLPGGAQNYPQCINLKVIGSGNDSLSNGTLGTELYDAQDPGLVIDIFEPLTNYTIPGPPLYAGAAGNAMASVKSLITSTVNAATVLALTTVTSTTTFTRTISTTLSVLPSA